ncbi:MAG: hypothetical protein ACREIM_10500, partial [Nitrospiraceae bacterium]
MSRTRSNSIVRPVQHKGLLLSKMFQTQYILVAGLSCIILGGFHILAHREAIPSLHLAQDPQPIPPAPIPSPSPKPLPPSPIPPP